MHKLIDKHIEGCSFIITRMHDERFQNLASNKCEIVDYRSPKEGKHVQSKGWSLKG
jgi:hypothetical protein